MTAPQNQPDVEPKDPPRVSETVQTKSPSNRKSFSNARRDLTEAELGTSAVQKLLLDEIDRLEEAVVDAKEVRAQFHDADKRAAVLAEKFKGKVSMEIFQIGCVTCGGILIGLSPSVWSVQHFGQIAACVGFLLVVTGIVAKALKP
jgi:hypothetical protein